ncbi:MAG TPA: pantetheine-phosphate adenylyltransferase [Spirochaetota bacterium]|jgi:pantetheine-phosphate adenylyltransferase|nr:pantetheine-phosphate adenylyltransferase [Spirochaetota bacterium]OQA99039.1 MAG: Phosphopantetheine adenylyltransferase [Spirochaetes bacterium ADurb.Bin218]HOK01769.1 pantetheine-phosphate adenylyltransferase [Spirochaetota bacterium]HOK91878.1 pantetheine-phosphate adenylyltransferase [Spirochaetota bacterium]HOQ11843.1 pantetheine-phosphate adenylyltransferase [Spirochaetota bacterium]
MRIGIYPGSFDPLTYGHLDVIERATKICDKLIVGILVNSAKKYLFDLEERIDILRHCCSECDKNIEIISFDGLLVDYCKENNISFIIRGLRAVSDFEYEITLASINRRLASDIETIFLMARDENLFVSSSLVKEVAMYKGDISTLVPPYVADKIRAKIS